MSEPTVSIAIATLNRRDDLRETLIELEKLDPPPLEVIVCLDGCTDGSAEMLTQFPSVKVISNEKPSGSVFSRDRLFKLACGDIIVSLDDDSYPTQTDFVFRLGRLSLEHPEVGVFALNEIRPTGKDDRIYSRPTDAQYIAGYPNCAGAIRAKIYGKQASYPTFFFHMYEEPDFCLQTYALGYGVLHVPEIVILHRYTHVGRNMIGRHHQHARNEFLSVLMRCPFPHVVWVAGYRVVRQLVYAASNGWSWVWREPAWWWHAIKAFPSAIRERNPVPWSVYWAWLRLARHPLSGDADTLKRAFPSVKSRMAKFTTVSEASKKEWPEAR